MAISTDGTRTIDERFNELGLRTPGLEAIGSGVQTDARHGERVRRKSFHRVLLSVLVAISMVAGMGHAVSAAAPASIVIHQHAPDMDIPAAMHAGHMMHAPTQPTPASQQHHHQDLAGCACCSMACCAAVLTPLASVSAASKLSAVAYSSLLATGRGVITVLEPDPPRPSTL